MTGTEIALELQKRKGKKPSPGTIYPVLKNMTEGDFLSVDEHKSYTLTEKGKKTLIIHVETFTRTFYDMDEMRSYLD